MPSPENTADRDPSLHAFSSLALALGGENPVDYITGMERQGQTQVVQSDVLPVRAPWEELAALGFQSGPDVDGDPLLCRVTLPEGWTRQGSSHAMWSYVLDERGVKRVAIFYKAAWYDRVADARIERPGLALAGEATYGDAEPALPAAWPLLTEEERADFKTAVDEYEQKAAEHPTVYGDRLSRARTLRQLVNND